MRSLFVAGALTLVITAPAMAGTPVDVRVEGQSATLVPETTVTTPDAPVSRGGDPGQECAGDSAVGALDAATGGQWDGDWGFGDQTVTTILGEEQPFDFGAEADYYWSFWVNFTYQNQGACQTTVQQGDDVLWLVDCYGDCPPARPLRLEAPATAKPGEPVQVTVTAYQADYSQFPSPTNASPAEGAAVGGATTDAEGRATLTFPERGEHVIGATKDGYVRSATRTICVTDGADGFCGTAKPGEPAVVTPAPEVDRTAPLGFIDGIRDGQVFRRGPRLLAGHVSSDPSGIGAVKIRLARTYGGHCWGLSRTRDRLIRISCKRPFWITIGDRQEFSYLLDRRLPRGRYVFQVRARDTKFNRDTLVGGRNQVKFRVR